MKMVILFTPRHLSSYNATFTLSAKNKNDKFSILQHEFHLDQVELIYFSKHTKGGRQHRESHRTSFDWIWDIQE